MDREELIRRLMATFLDELDEHVEAWNRDLLALEKAEQESDRAELLNTLFRTAHSVKGAARSVNLEQIERACHRLETLLDDVRKGVRTMDPSIVDLLYRAGDALAETGVRLRTDQPLEGGMLVALAADLVTTAGRRRRRRRGANEADTSVVRDARDQSVVEQAPEPVPVTSEMPLSVPVEVAEPERIEPTVELGRSARSTWQRREVGGSIRVNADKIDALLADSGELTILTSRMEQQLGGLELVGGTLGDLRGAWRGFEQLLFRLYRAADEADAIEVGSQRATELRRLADVIDSSRTRIRAAEGQVERLRSGLARRSHTVVQSVRRLDEDARRMRMVPFAEVTSGLERTVRDVSRSLGKQVQLVIEGGAVEIDRSVARALSDPLRHLVRNAIDHGIESEEDRTRARKSPRAEVRVEAALRGAQVEITVRDDGGGVDRGAVRSRLKSLGAPVPESDEELLRTLFSPGFSTAGSVTELSGRGVGLDVVRTEVEALHGSVDVTSTLGAGTRFALTVPLTLTTVRALVVRENGVSYAFVSTSVLTTVRITPESIRTLEGQHVIVHQNDPIPVASLSDVLGETHEQSQARMYAVVVSGGDRRLAVVIDELVAEQELVVKSLGPRLRRVPNISGATVDDTGEITLILNAAELVRSALDAGQPSFSRAVDTVKTARRTRIVVADDSLTTRTLEQSILEAEGYEVFPAANGQQAWRLVQLHEPDLVVSDVEMPAMNGFELARTLRGSDRHRTLPIILVTTLDSDSYRRQGMEAGASAYLVKSAFDHEVLLDTIRRLL